MIDRIRLTRYYLIASIFLLFGLAYGVLDLTPDPTMRQCLGSGPILIASAWLAADCRRTHVANVYDAGWLFYIGWPFSVLWYALRTRGRAGWWLGLRLYAISLAALLGWTLGEVLHHLRSP
jgi:hypothetical protein